VTWACSIGNISITSRSCSTRGSLGLDAVQSDSQRRLAPQLGRRHREPIYRLEDLSSATEHWRRQLQVHPSPASKRVIYWFIRPALSAVAARNLESDEFRTFAGRTRVLPERGLLPASRRAWANKYGRLRNKMIAVIGTGNGSDAITWRNVQPARIFAVDLYPFFSSWRDIRSRYPTISFLVANNEELPLADNSMDFIASDGVLEHCRDVPEVMRESFRVLRPGGYVYATYGPMWFCFGGDHYSGRGGLAHGFSHIELPAEEYRTYFLRYKLADEDAQNGGRYLELDLFSHFTTHHYVACFKSVGFYIVELILEISHQAVQFRSRWPERFQSIAKHNGVSCDDLIVKSNFVLLRKPA
jgi:ubiquinone/menaquinone biosynthesis C-methylase UbiE